MIPCATDSYYATQLALLLSLLHDSHPHLELYSILTHLNKDKSKNDKLRNIQLEPTKHRQPKRQHQLSYCSF